MAIFRFLVILAIFLFNASVSALPKSSISVAAVQLKTADAGNFSKIRELVKKARMQGAELVIFPEESVFGWLNPNVFFEAASIPGKYSDAFASIAKDENIWLAAGLGEQGTRSRVWLPGKCSSSLQFRNINRPSGKYRSTSSAD